MWDFAGGFYRPAGPEVRGRRQKFSLITNLFTFATHLLAKEKDPDLPNGGSRGIFVKFK